MPDLHILADEDRFVCRAWPSDPGEKTGMNRADLKARSKQAGECTLRPRFQSTPKEILLKMIVSERHANKEKVAAYIVQI